MDINTIINDNNRYIVDYVLPIKKREYIRTDEYRRLEEHTRSLEEYIRDLEEHTRSLEEYIRDLEERNRQWERIRASVPYRIARKIKKLIKKILGKEA